MCEKFDIIAFDADDTLWYNEVFYLKGRDFFSQLFAQYADADHAGRTLDMIETDNVQYYGYGVKSFILSMIEAAATLTDGRVDGKMVNNILDYAKQMVRSDPIHFPNTRATLEILIDNHDLMMITKGDLHEQQGKIARSGLGHYFRYIEVVSDKTPETYRTLLEKYGIAPKNFIMFGNSLRSDILPVIEIGGRAVYIPYELTWDHEKALDRVPESTEYHELENIGQVPGFIQYFYKD